MTEQPLWLTWVFIPPFKTRTAATTSFTNMATGGVRRATWFLWDKPLTNKRYVHMGTEK